VDHIVPKSTGGTDDPENLQALCWLCNTNKGAGDDAAVADLRAALWMQHFLNFFPLPQGQGLFRPTLITLLVESPASARNVSG
jgi:hypothetical protein